MISSNSSRFRTVFSRLCNAANEVLGVTGKVRIDVSFVTEQDIAELNARTRGTDRATDVLSYPYLDQPTSPFVKERYPLDYNARMQAVELGCIVICPDFIERAAKEDRTVYIKDVYRAFTHGILHLLGYDHVTEEQYDQMHGLENQIMIKAGLKV